MRLLECAFFCILGCISVNKDGGAGGGQTDAALPFCARRSPVTEEKHANEPTAAQQAALHKAA